MPSQDWNGIAYGNGVFVAVSAYNTNAVYSGDGIHWTNAVQGLPDAGYWQAVTYGNGIFVAIVGGDNESAYSTDGSHWSVGNGLPSADWAGLTYGNGVFVATADYSSLLGFSTNGMDWYEDVMPVDDNWYPCAYGSGAFVSLSQGGGYSAYSTNAINWTVSTTSLPYPDVWYGLAAADNCSVITAQPYSQEASAGGTVTFSVGASGSGVSYQWRSNGVPISGATTSTLTLGDVTGAFAGNYEVIVSNACGETESLNAVLVVTPPSDVALFAAAASDSTNAIYSMDGTTWLQSPTGMPNASTWDAVIYTDNRFVAVPWAADLTSYSYDGRNWIAAGTMPSASEWVDLAWGNGKLVAVAYDSANAAYSTNDGLNWSSSTLQTGSSGWNCVGCGNGVFVTLQANSTNAMYSGDGVSWTNTGPLPYSAYWQCITYGNGVFAALVGGTDQAAYSPNGIVWSNATGLPSANWASITYGNGKFVAMAYDSATTAYSSNGITWYQGTNVTSDLWFSSAYSDGIFVAPAISSSNAAWSTNGMTWSNSATGIPYTNGWYSIAGNTTSTGYITNGLVAWWKLNDGSGANAADSSGYDNTLPLIGSPSWGDDYLILNGTTQYGDGGSSMLTILDNSSMTICAWINTTSTAAQGIVDKSYYTVCSDRGGWSFYVQANQLHFSLEDCGGDPPADNGAATVPLGQWTFVAMTWYYPGNSGNQVCYYIDGIQNSAPIDGAAMEESSGAAHLQVGNVRSSNPFQGSMHDVAVYNRALSSNEIASNFLATQFITNMTAVPVPDLLDYKMTEGSANTNCPQYLTDSSSHGGTTGTISGAYVIWTNNIIYTPITALHFNGSSDYVDTGNAALFNFTNNSFSINVWLLPNNQDGVLIGNSSYQTSGWFLSVNSDQIHFGAETNGNEYDIYTGDIQGWPAPNAFGEWHMITVTRQSTNTPLIYIDGLQATTAGTFVNPASSPNSLKFGVGTNSLSTNYYYDGDMWQPQIWSTALSSQQIVNLYFSQKLGYPWP